MASKSRKLRTGFTTGACAAAAAKAALLSLGGRRVRSGEAIEIPFPDGERRGLEITRVWAGETHDSAWASITKDAGDDPDVTDGMEIRVRVVATIHAAQKDESSDAEKGVVVIKGGEGVGTVTRPGLSLPIGEPAINPVPRRMIMEAVSEVFSEVANLRDRWIEVLVTAPLGESIAKKTLNSRLGIVGGISILGTTGIVRPISAEAWTASVSASMSVARAMGREEVVLSSGRSSERAHMRRYGLPEEAYVMMGDYIEFALREATSRKFRQIHLAAQWAKMLKVAMAVPQTHVRHGAIDLGKALALLEGMGFPKPTSLRPNTAREVFDMITAPGAGHLTPFLSLVCAKAREYAESMTDGVPVRTHLVSYEGEIIAEARPSDCTKGR